MAGSAVGIALSTCLVLWSFGLYIEPLEEGFGWSRAEVSLAISIALLTSGLASPLVGRWIDRRGARSALLAGALLGAVAYVLLSTTHALWQWYLFYGLAGVALSMTFFIPFQTLASLWFDRRRGVALGILAVGISLGGLLGVPIFRVIIDALDWDGAFLVAAVLLLAYFVPFSLFVVRNNPHDVGLVVDGRQSPPGAPRRRPTPTGLSLGRAIRTPVFWALTLAIALFFYASFGMIVHAVPLFESIDLSPGLAAALLSVMAGSGIASRLAIAWLADRGRRFEPIAMIVCGAGLLASAVFLFDTSALAIALFLLFWAVAEGGPAMLEPVSIIRVFGVAHFATILGTVAVIRTTIMIPSPVIVGAIFDTTGSYDWALVMYISGFAAAILLFYIAMRLPRPVVPAPAAPASPAAARGALD